MEYEHKGELEHQTVKIDSLELRYDHKGIYNSKTNIYLTDEELINLLLNLKK